MLAVADAQRPRAFARSDDARSARLWRAGDLLVFNDTRVVAARLLGTKPSGGRVEMLLERALGETCEALVQLAPASRARRTRSRRPPAARCAFSAPTRGPVAHRNARARRWNSSSAGARCRCRRIFIAPPEASDRERYQSIFARERGAVAAPTASLHFDAAIGVADRARAASSCAFVTLHVGAGTFQPLRTDDLDSHVHARRARFGERGRLRGDQAARAAGGRVIARRHDGRPRARVGGAAAGCAAWDSRRSWSGETRLFIRPGFRFRSSMRC